LAFVLAFLLAFALAAGGCVPLAPAYQTADTLAPDQSQVGFVVQVPRIRNDEGVAQLSTLQTLLCADAPPEIFYREGVADGLELGFRYRADVMVVNDGIEGDAKLRLGRLGPLTLAVDPALQAYPLLASGMAEVTGIATLDVTSWLSLNLDLLEGVGVSPAAAGWTGSFGFDGPSASPKEGAPQAADDAPAKGPWLETRGGSVGIRLRGDSAYVMPALEWQSFRFTRGGEGYVSMGLGVIIGFRD
jgi:hypothetical protein